MILMFAVLWFLMVRPQMKKAKEHKALLAALALGDEVVTQGGIIGKISKKVNADDSYVTVQIAQIDGDKGTEPKAVEVVVQKPSIGLVLPKGTLKTL
jgi:preprotein translocase subunit YajC